jgi:outer membrane protein
LILILSLEADTLTNYSLRGGYGVASDNDLGEILSGDVGSTSKDLSVVSIDGGYLLKKDLFDLPLDIYLKGGFAYFNEAQNDDVFEATVYIKLIYNFDFWSNRVRLGFGEGVSLASEVLEVEADEAYLEDDETSKFLNYLDITLDFDLGRLVRYKPLEDVYIGYLLKHRSGVFGLFNGVHGGSNYNTFYIETNF